ALAKRITAQNVVDARDHGIVEGCVACDVGSRGEDDKIVENAAVGTPRPAVRWRVGLAPGLLLLKLQNPQRPLSHAVNDPVMVGQVNAGECEVEAGWSAHPVEVEPLDIEDMDIEDVGGVQRRAEQFASEV